MHLLGDGWAGSLSKAISAFKSNGALPVSPDTRTGRSCADDMPGVSGVANLNVAAGGEAISSARFVVGYDDVASIKYFGHAFKGFLTTAYESIDDALMDAHSEFDAMMAESINHDNKLVRRLIEAGGEKYGIVSSLAYRQTLAATQLVWNDKQKVMWNFLKENFHEWRHANNGCNFPCITYAPVRQSRAPQTAFNSESCICSKPNICPIHRSLFSTSAGYISNRRCNDCISGAYAIGK